MLFNIFKSEIKYQLKNITFYLLIVVVLMFHFTQFGRTPSRFEILEKPKRIYSQGISEASSHYELILFTIDKLEHDMNNGYTLKKSSTETSKVELSSEQIDAIRNVYIDLKDNIDNGKITDKNISDYEGFNESGLVKKLNELDNLLGGGTYYSFENISDIDDVFPKFISQDDKFEYIKEDLIQKVEFDLLCEYTLKYPLGIAKKYVLNEEQKKELKKYSLELKEQSTVNGLIEVINKIDTLLEGGSMYNTEQVKFYGDSNETEKEYYDKMDKMINKDKITGGFGRLFSDYIGIPVGFFTAFIAAYILIRDKKNNIMETIYTKKFSPFSYVMGKYLAVSVLMYAVVLLVAGYVTVDFCREFALNGIEIDIWIFIKYATIWILPTILFVNALAMTTSVIFQNGLIVIIIQFVMWQINISSGLIGKFKLTEYIIRYNTEYGYEYFVENYSKFITNRIFYVLISFVLVGICSIIFEKRRGNINGGVMDKFKFFKA